MKTHPTLLLKSLCGLAAVSLTLNVSAIPFVYSPRDLVFSIRKQGGTFEAAANLGPSTRFTDAVPGTRIDFTEFSKTQLDDAFDTLDEVSWAVGGCVRIPGDGGDQTVPVSTLWVTRPRSDIEVQTTPWVQQAKGFNQAVAAKINSLGSNADRYSTTSVAPGDNNTTSYVRIAAGDQLSLSQYLGAGGNYGGSFQGKVENTTPANFSSPTRSDLYESRPGSGPSKWLGYFEFTSAGTLSFVAAGESTPPPKPLLSIAQTGEATKISFPTVAGVTYKLRYTDSTGLGTPATSWTLATATVIGDGNTQTLEDTSSAANRFYVVEATR